jgi:hypothetical protein
MNYGEPVDSILLKAHRAHARILNLETAYNSFMTTEPRTYTITFETDANTEDRLYSLKKIVPIPREFSLRIRDALNNFRSCLDHSVYTMIKVASFNNVKESDIKFPIYYSATEYKNGFKRIEPGLRPDAIKAINSIQPYVGGQGDTFATLPSSTISTNTNCLRRSGVVASFILCSPVRDNGSLAHKANNNPTLWMLSSRIESLH